ncbi:Hypp938 [Branchiostoma lanceolatum]|uniref:Hypp938 protein n=1 Tax=Branchiostoma lanceolatum TaxID=7740 RepID=A0A8J9ZG65_BRALA|nr:Hypp938 [Branchiostoma lanceolatum]
MLPLRLTKLREREIIQFKHVFYVKKQVSNKWEDLAGFLGFDPPAISNIKGRNEDDASCCKDMLQEWKRRKGDAATMGVLMEALTEADLGGVVDGLKKKFPDPDLPVHLKLSLAPQTSGQGQTGDISNECKEQIWKRILELDRKMFPEEVLEDPERHRQKLETCFLPHVAVYMKLLSGSVILLLRFLRQTDVDRFYHNHYRVGEGTLSQQLSHILISDELRDKVKGAQLIVRLHVKHEDYVRVRDRLGQGLDRTTSVDNLLALPSLRREVDHSSLRGLDLAVASTEDRPCTDRTDDGSTLNFTARQVQGAVQTSKQKSQQQVRRVEGEMRTELHTAREQTDAVVRSQTLEITRLREKEDKAQKVLLEQKEENQKLQEANKSQAATKMELMYARHMLAKYGSPEEDQVKKEDTGKEEDPGKDQVKKEDPGKDPEKNQDQGKEKDPGKDQVKKEDPEKDPEKNQDQGKEKDTGKDQVKKEDPGKDPEKNQDQGKEEDPGKDPGKEPEKNQDPGKDQGNQTGVRRYFFFIKEEVKSGWKDLAIQLGFRRSDSNRIAGRNPDDQSRCMDLLEEWLKRNRDRATIEVLMEALSEANLQSTVDGLKNKYPELGTPGPGPLVSRLQKRKREGELLPAKKKAYHGEGEGILFEYIFYIKTKASESWKNLAGFLGFDSPAIGNIERRNPDDSSSLGDLLGEWQARKGDEATMGVLMEALTKIDREGVVKGLKNKFPELREEPMPQPGPIENAMREAAGPAGKPGGSGAGAKTTTPTKRRRTSDGAAAKPGGSGAKMVPSAKRRRKIDVEEYFLHTKNQVAADWRDLARCLEFTTPDIGDIDTQHRRDKDRCMELLQQWHTRNGDGATIHVLMEALAKAGLKRVVDSLKEEYPELAAGKKSPKGAKQKSRRTPEEEADVEKSPDGPRLKQRRVSGVQQHDPAEVEGTPAVEAPKRHVGLVLSRLHMEAKLMFPRVIKPVVLLLNDEYGTRKGGISTIHRQMCLLAAKGAKVYSTVLDAEDVTQQDMDDAEADGVELIFPKTFKGDKRKPGLDWLTWDHRSRFPNLPPNIGFIVGHVNITSRAARHIKEQRFPHAKLVQVTHVIPEDVARFKSEDKELSIEEEKASILEDLLHADVIVSVGPRLHDYYTNETRRAEDHYEFLPEPSDIFKNTKVKYVETETKGVLSVGRVKGVERLKGYDLSAKAMGKVIKRRPNTKWRARGIKHEDFSESKAIIQANISKFEFAPFTPLKYSTQEDLSRDMQQAHVVLMPSRAEPFGLVGLEAIAAGVPVLVSDKSGLAWFLGKDSDLDRPIVKIEEDDDKAAETLAERIVEILENGRKEFDAAKKLKKNLLDSEYWVESHRKFLEIFGLSL